MSNYDAIICKWEKIILKDLLRFFFYSAHIKHPAAVSLPDVLLFWN